MDQVLELLNADSPREAAQLLSVDVLTASKEPTKHKLKTKISSLLKSSGAERAYGAVLARQALQDWSVVKSHGGSWVVIMLHALDLPDQICWKPICRTLADLFVRVQGKPDLLREIGGGAKIGDFMKRLVSTLPTTKLDSVATLMLRHFPTQSRPYINKLLPVLRCPEAIACTCIAEKKAAEVWQERVTGLLAQIDSDHDKVEGLMSYVRVAHSVHAKVPAQQIIDMLVRLLNALKPAAALAACRFISQTFEWLGTLYVQRFEDIAFRVAECFDLGLKPSIAGAKVLFLLIGELGWISEKYSQLFSRLQKRVLKILDSREIAPGAEGLADYVQNKASFAVPLLSPHETSELVSYLRLVCVNVPGIPQSLRVQTDRVVLQLGSEHDVVQATLYTAKYSILPLAIDRLPTLHGLETLVHPRFPPLSTSKMNLEMDSVNFATNDTVEEQTEKLEEVDEPVEEVEVVEKETVQAPLPKIPESHQPKRRSDTPLSSPPEKKVKPVAVSDMSEQVTADLAEPDNAEESDEEIVIPVLTMDSD